MFAYGFLSVVLALCISELGFSEAAIGVLLSLTLIGDAMISLSPPPFPLFSPQERYSFSREVCRSC